MYLTTLKNKKQKQKNNTHNNSKSNKKIGGARRRTIRYSRQNPHTFYGRETLYIISHTGSATMTVTST